MTNDFWYIVGKIHVQVLISPDEILPSIEGLFGHVLEESASGDHRLNVSKFSTDTHWLTRVILEIELALFKLISVVLHKSSQWCVFL